MKPVPPLPLDEAEQAGIAAMATYTVAHINEADCNQKAQAAYRTAFDGVFIEHAARNYNGSFKQRVTFALRCLAREYTGLEFDACFNKSDGALVVQAIMYYAAKTFVDGNGDAMRNLLKNQNLIAIIHHCEARYDGMEPEELELYAGEARAAAAQRTMAQAKRIYGSAL